MIVSRCYLVSAGESSQSVSETTTVVDFRLDLGLLHVRLRSLRLRFRWWGFFPNPGGSERMVVMFVSRGKWKHVSDAFWRCLVDI
jgi:hypothetical protein